MPEGGPNNQEKNPGDFNENDTEEYPVFVPEAQGEPEDSLEILKRGRKERDQALDSVDKRIIEEETKKVMVENAKKKKDRDNKDNKENNN